MPITQSFQRDANSVPITGLGLVASKDIIYSTLTTGATGATTLFTVTGLVAMRVWAVCSTDLTGANATLEVGIANNTASIITTTTGTTIDAGEIWTATNPPSVVALPDLLLINGTDVIQTIAVAAVSGGELTYYCAWFPLTPSATVVAA